MPTLTVEHPHTLSPPEARLRLDKRCIHFADEYSSDVKWTDEAHATSARKGASASITCGAGRIVVVVNLSLMLWPLKSTLESRIRKELVAVVSGQ